MEKKRKWRNTETKYGGNFETSNETFWTNMRFHRAMANTARRPSRQWSAKLPSKMWKIGGEKNFRSGRSVISLFFLTETLVCATCWRWQLRNSCVKKNWFVVRSVCFVKNKIKTEITSAEGRLKSRHESIAPLCHVWQYPWFPTGGWRKAAGGSHFCWISLVRCQDR